MIICPQIFADDTICGHRQRGLIVNVISSDVARDSLSSAVNWSFMSTFTHGLASELRGKGIEVRSLNVILLATSFEMSHASEILDNIATPTMLDYYRYVLRVVRAIVLCHMFRSEVRICF